MPIEIRELIIKAFVETPDSRTQTDDPNSKHESEQILAESLQQIMDLFNNKNER